MNEKSLWVFVGILCAFCAQAFADGFIIIEPPEHPIIVPPGHFRFAPLEVSSHHVEVKINDQIATTSVEQEFYNPNNQRLEGIYLFPVPKGAHIDKFSMEIGGKMVDAELLDADKARQIYEDIVRKMRDPALLEYAGRDVFKVRIFPIEPLARKQVKITYTELLRSDSGTVTYTYPLSTEKYSAQPIKSLSVKVELTTDKPLSSIYSPSHKVEIKRDGANRAIVGYEATNEKPDTDFQLVYSRDTQDIGVSLMSYKTEGEDGSFLLLAAPTINTKNDSPAPKDVVFVVDTSGSMAGEKLNQAKKALKFCVENLNATDRFEIVRFSTEAEPLFNKLVEPNEENRKRADIFIQKLKPIGGTAIANALQSVVKTKPDNSDRPFVVIFLTDGLPTVGTKNEEELISIVRKAAENIRVFCFGIGSDVNTHLLDQLAEKTRAFSRYVLASGDIEVKVSSFFTRIKEPALTNLRLEFDGGDVRVSKLYPAELPDLFKGDQLVLSGRYSGSGEVQVKLTGLAGGKEQTFTYQAKLENQNAEHEFIPRLWATRRVGFLLDEIRLHGENKELRDEVTDLARRYGIVTPYTAYLIVEDEAQRAVPLAQRSLQEFDLDKSAQSQVSDAWKDFKMKKDGADAVANARSGNLLKYAEQPALTVNSAAKETLAGAVATAPTAKAESARLTRYTQQAKYVNGRAFFHNGKQWVDAQTQSLTKRAHVQFGSDEYYDLLKKHPEAAQWLALGQNLLLALDGTVYEISE